MDSRATEYYSAEQYERLVARTGNPMVKSYMALERDFVERACADGTKTSVDLGAGYGRVLPLLSMHSKRVIAVEINKDELAELANRAKGLGSVEVVEGDMTKLSEILPERLERPLFMLLQNTLGTVRGGHEKVLQQVKAISQRETELLVSVLRQGALASHGIEFYRSIAEMVGEPDMQKTDTHAGIFMSKTGYVSKWWTDSEIRDMKAFFGGNVIREVVEPAFWMFHVAIL